MKNINLIIDFDSTFIKLETIEILAKISLKNNPDKNIIMNKIETMTKMAMSGKLSFQKALIQRINLINANKRDVRKTIELIKKHITDSIRDNLKFFKDNYKDCYIISGGFTEIIAPVVLPYGIDKNKIFANELIYDEKDNIISINEKNLLSMDRGKVKVAKKIKGNNIIIGDGYTDYELKKYKAANLFIQFIENIDRKGLNNKADFIAKDFNNVINYLEENYA